MSPDREWYKQQEIADMLGVNVRQVYNVVSALRRLGQIKTTPDPTDERVILVHRDSIPTLRTALWKNDPNAGGATA